MNIWEHYLSTLDEKRSKLVLETLYKAQSLVPVAELAMPYGVPGLKFKNKNLIAVAAHKTHLGIYPFSPTIVKEIIKTEDLEFSEGTLRFQFECPPTNQQIKKIIDLRITEINKIL